MEIINIIKILENNSFKTKHSSYFNFCVNSWGNKVLLVGKNIGIHDEADYY